MNQGLDPVIAAPTAETAIAIDAEGTARIAGTRIKVAQITQEYSRLGLTEKQIAESHPHLSIDQVQAALGYYRNHQEAIEAQINASLVYADLSRQEAQPSKVALKLRAAKRDKERQPA